MSWSKPHDLKAQIQRLWDRGELLRDGVNDTVRFPLRLSLRTPNSTEIANRFEDVRAWVAELSAMQHCRIEWRMLRHRVHGAQRLPASAGIESLEDALNWLGKRRDWERFGELVELTKNACPALLAWLGKRPLQALALAENWPQLLAIVAWLIEHPRPAIHLRQIDLPGIHSKFIEAHRGVLAELLDMALTGDAIDVTKVGVGQFAARYGFLEKPWRIRFRVLDPAISLVPNAPCPDITLDADSLARLRPPVRRVFITENETNFLAFPRLARTIVLFGAGYGWGALGRCRWLDDCAIHYWGDIDTHGFAILDQLRGHFAHAQSFLMDRATLDAHVRFWGTEQMPASARLTRLTTEEQALYDDLRDNRIRRNLRLEQEHVGFGWLQDRLAECIDSTRSPD